jgi:hypothetical protein
MPKKVSKSLGYYDRRQMHLEIELNRRLEIQVPKVIAELSQRQPSVRERVITHISSALEHAPFFPHKER